MPSISVMSIHRRCFGSRRGYQVISCHWIHYSYLEKRWCTRGTMTKIVYIHLELDRLTRIYIISHLRINRLVITYTSHVHSQVTTSGKTCMVNRGCPTAIRQDGIITRNNYISSIIYITICLTSISRIYIRITSIISLSKILF